MAYKGNNNYFSNEDLSQLTQKLTRNALSDWGSKYRKKYIEKNKASTFNHFNIFFPQERAIHSIIQSGLTSFGTKLWENLSYEIAKLNGYNVVNKTVFNSDVPVLTKGLENHQQELRKDIENKKINLKDAIEDIRSYINQHNIYSLKRTSVKKGAGIDFWFKKNGYELIGDIKSPQENIGNSKKLAEHILIWSTHRLLDDPKAKINAVIALPYNPYDDLDTYMKEQGNKMSILNHGNDILLADDFWDKLSGIKNSTNIIFEAFESLSNSKEVNEIKKFFPSR